MRSGEGVSSEASWQVSSFPLLKLKPQRQLRGPGVAECEWGPSVSRGFPERHSARLTLHSTI